MTDLVLSRAGPPPLWLRAALWAMNVAPTHVWTAEAYAARLERLGFSGLPPPPAHSRL